MKNSFYVAQKRRSTHFQALKLFRLPSEWFGNCYSCWDSSSIGKILSSQEPGCRVAIFSSSHKSFLWLNALTSSVALFSVFLDRLSNIVFSSRRAITIFSERSRERKSCKPFSFLTFFCSPPLSSLGSNKFKIFSFCILCGKQNAKCSQSRLCLFLIISRLPRFNTNFLFSAESLQIKPFLCHEDRFNSRVGICSNNVFAVKICLLLLYNSPIKSSLSLKLKNQRPTSKLFSSMQSSF